MIIPPKKRRLPVCGTVAQWARFFGWSWYQTDQMIKAAGIAPRLKGTMKLYYLKDWREMDPDLWESLRLSREASGEDEGSIEQGCGTG